MCSQACRGRPAACVARSRAHCLKTLMPVMATQSTLPMRVLINIAFNSPYFTFV